jgi:hypothetical protein
MATNSFLTFILLIFIMESLIQAIGQRVTSVASEGNHTSFEHTSHGYWGQVTSTGNFLMISADHCL